MKIIILSVSKKDDVWSEGEEMYLKRLTRFTDLSIDKISHSDTETESEKLLSKIVATDYVVLLDEAGSNISSLDFATLIDEKQNDSVKRVIFIIGGAYGVSDEIKTRANYTMSFGKMVWPHALCRAMLLEQVYRAYTILNNVKYHNE